MNYTVNLGCWGSIFAVPTSVVDKHIKIAGSAQLKVLLYILRHSGESFDVKDVAGALNMDPFDVKDCIEFWASFDVLSVSGGEITPAKGNAAVTSLRAQMHEERTAEVSSPILQANETKAADLKISTATRSDTIETQKQSAPEKPAENEKPKKEKPSAVVTARPLRPDPVYIAKRVSEDPEISSLYEEAQYILGRPISPNENAGLLMLHDNDGLPSEVILMLLTYGISNKMGMKQIEIMGAQWARDGVLTLEHADEKIRQIEESKEAYHHIQKLYGLDYRKPSTDEEALYSCWIYTWKFPDDMLKFAYDKCIGRNGGNGKYSAPYINGILKKWHEQGIKTLELAKAEDKEHMKNREKSAKSSGSNRSTVKNFGEENSSFNIDDLKDIGFYDDE